MDNPSCSDDYLWGGGIFSCDLIGRYLSITLEYSSVLTLCEVKAFEGENLALNTPQVKAWQSSSGNNHGEAMLPIKTHAMSGIYE